MVSDDTVGISASGGVTIKKFSGEDEDYDYEEWKETMQDLITLKKLKYVLEPSFTLPTRNDQTRWKIVREMTGIYEDASKLAKDPGICNYDEGEILLNEQVRSEMVEILDVLDAADTYRVTNIPRLSATFSTIEVRGHRMTLRSHKSSPVEINLTQKMPKRDVMTDGKRKVTGNTKVKRITLDDSIIVIEEEKKGKLNGLITSALFIFNTSLNSDPGEQKTNKEALNGPEKDWWLSACIAEINNFLDRGS